MNYLDEIFKRGDVQQIREFLLHGVESNTDPSPYKERVESAQKRVTARLREEYPDSKDYEELLGLVYDYVTVVEAIYMEIGMQLDTILVAQVRQNLITAFEGNE